MTEDVSFFDGRDVAEAAEPGNGAGTTKTVYFRAQGILQEESIGNCISSKFAGLPCKIEPAAQPGTSGQPQVLVKKVLSYNAAGRQTSEKITGGGTAILEAETLYSESTGAPTVQRFCTGYGCPTARQETTTTYDALGRPFQYEASELLLLVWVVHRPGGNPSRLQPGSAATTTLASECERVDDPVRIVTADSTAAPSR